jgi:hypothetical protein
VAPTYHVGTRTRAGTSRIHEYTTEDALGPGAVLRLDGRFWLVERVEPAGDSGPERLVASPARYRVRLSHPDGREELGAFRRFRLDGPRLGHAFTTLEDGQPVSWQVMDERLEFDEQGEAYLELLAERDFAEVETLPDHELEHALVRSEETLSEGVFATFERAQAEGLAVELAALEPGEVPDWEEAERYIDALVFEEIEDDLFELCGVDLRTRRETWLPTVKERLHADLERFRADIEGDHDEIEEWEFLEGRIFVSVGSPDDEADPDSGHGWMCRLLDAGALAAAGFARVRKAELVV